MEHTHTHEQDVKKKKRIEILTGMFLADAQHNGITQTTPEPTVMKTEQLRIPGIEGFQKRKGRITSK